MDDEVLRSAGIDVPPVQYTRRFSVDGNLPSEGQAHIQQSLPDGLPALQSVRRIVYCDETGAQIEVTWKSDDQVDVKPDHEVSDSPPSQQG
jgi:hypothetical protein